MNVETINSLWPLGAAVVGMTAWFVRLEAKVMYLEKDKKIMWNKLDDIQDSLTKILQALAKLEGKLENKE